MSGPVVVLAGGTGGAKLARGMLDVVGEDLTVIANTADDIEIYGAYVSPDPDLVSFWLADRIDERGWGLAGDTFHVMDGLRELGVDVWFNLGDRDLAIGIERQRMLREGARLTESIARLTSALNIPATVLPMSDDPVRTRVRASGRWRGFQEFMIQARGQGPIEDIEFRGARSARVSDEVLGAVAEARAIVIGPSNPVLSIGPILALAQMRTAIAASRVPVVAVSPLVRGTVVKGPTAACMEWAGWPLSSEGIALAYAGVIDGLIADRPTDQLPVLETDVLMDDPDSRRRLAEQALTFALGLSG